MLEPQLAASIEGHLDKLRHDITFVTSLDESDAAARIAEFVDQVAALSPRLSVDRNGTAARRPSFRIERVGGDVGVAFAAIPLGHEFTSFVLALLQVGGHPPVVDDHLASAIAALDGDYAFETFISLSCQNCPDVVQALNIMSVLNPRVRHVTVDGALFKDEMEAKEIGSVPAVHLDGEVFGFGRMVLADILAKIDHSLAAADAERLSGYDPFDVLVVGGGPGGAAAALYTARKGLRTAIASDRMGGQLLDTMGIENFVSVPYTEGPRLAVELEQHVATADVELITPQTASALAPATEPGGLHTVTFESGATLQARTVVLATGARWRKLGCPGEEDYLNRGVAFCPHCDGPIYKGKRVAVIGGGNSGVEAAIDLAGLASRVTLIEFTESLIADDVLQRSLRDLENVEVILHAATAEIIGDGAGVTGLRYDDRATEQSHTVDLDGVFVQIGLVPNTEWLRGSVELTDRGEIVIDDRGRTDVAGVVAAGDCTTEPYKQIVVAMGGGSTAGLSAFDHLIRTSAQAEAS